MELKVGDKLIYEDKYEIVKFEILDIGSNDIKIKTYYRHFKGIRDALVHDITTHINESSLKYCKLDVGQYIQDEIDRFIKD